MRKIDEFNFENKRVLVRVDLNVPLNKEFQVTDETRINAIIPTVKKIINGKGKAILMSHLGRPDGEKVEKYSLKHVVATLSKKLGVTVQFVDDCIGNNVKTKVNNLKAGEVLLLENLRYYKQETKGDEAFSKSLAELGDMYVNDAFGTAHRAHASTCIVANYFKDKCCGYVMQAEVDNAKKVLGNAQKPFTAVMGGAKISDKILIIENLIDRVDNLIIGGGMSYTFFKAQGANIGNSLVEENQLPLALKLIEKAKAKKVNLLLPKDSIVANKFENGADFKEADNFKIETGWMGLDIGSKAIAEFTKVIENSKTILWNGPMGVFEMSNFAKGTHSIADAVVKATKNGAFSLIGGGDSAAAINQLGLGDQVSYVSTGGGALLEFMEGKVLPGVAALEK